MGLGVLYYPRAILTWRNLMTAIEEGSEIRLRATLFSLESAYGSVKPSANPEDFTEISRNAKDAKSEDTVRELRYGRVGKSKE